MSYLLLKMFFMLLLSALLGGALAWWWLRRHYEDITAEYSRWSVQIEQWRQHLEERLATLPMVDLRPVLHRVDELEAVLRQAHAPAPAPAADLSPLFHRLAALEHSLEAQIAHLRAPPPPAAVPAQVLRSTGRNLLQYAACGRPDDLKRIVGVAEVLEGLLNRIGVYYFWQVAEWTPQDVAAVDAQLVGFKGRIERTQWVAQCTVFAREPGAAQKPAL